MLDLEALVADMRGLAGEIRRTADAAGARRDLALVQLEAAAAIPALREAVLEFGRDMALPAAACDLRAVHPTPPPEDYTVIAADGSQVPPDYHHLAPWYVVNTGCAVLRYGAAGDRERCMLRSWPLLKPPRAVQAEPGADGHAAAVSLPPRLEAERLKAELQLAARLLEEEADPGRTVLLLDGPLVQWRMLQELRPGAERSEVLEAFGSLVSAARGAGAAVAGFVSRPRAVEWVTLLRFSLCPEVAGAGRLCRQCRETLLRRDAPAPAAHHARLAGLRDAELAEALLPLPGSRTGVVELRSSTWLEISGGGGAAGFFYLRTGRREQGGEIARVELPQWVWEDQALMRRLHIALADQCEVGGGYPLALAEAHEAAVVRAADRDAFYLLIERILTEERIDGAFASAKGRSKSRPGA